jgi:DNA-binding NtrC family response regulator
MPAEGGSRVLVADDEDILQRLMTRVLERGGFEVVAVGDGDAAAAAFREDPSRFALVVLDVTIPPRGGEAALREILEIRADVPVLLTSGADIGPGLSDLLARCNGDFLPKPFAPADLLSAARHAADGSDA